MNPIEKIAVAAFPFLEGFGERVGGDPFLERSVGGCQFEEYRRVLENRVGTVAERAKTWLRFYGITDGIMSFWMNSYANMLMRRKVPGCRELRCLDPYLGVLRDGFSRDIVDDDACLKTLGQESFAALKADKVAEFVMLKDLRKFNLTASLFPRMLMSRGCEKIITWLLANDKKIQRFLSPREMLLYGCGGCPSFVKSSALIDAALAQDESCVRQVDAKGMTPLHYTVFKRIAIRECPSGSDERKDELRHWLEGLEQRLIELGCDADAEDVYGLSWRNICALYPNSVQ